jgi:hypothetical protein
MNVRALGLAAALTLSATAAVAQADPWAPIRRLAGEWAGTSSGQPGDGTVTRRYGLVLGDKYLHETNTTDYPPQERNKKGERHEHWGVFSFDRQQKALVLRHFHVEGFVNTYRQVTSLVQPDVVVFESVAFENLPAEWKARETYQFVGDDEVIETFELAPPGKPYQTYSRAQLQRVRR